MPNLQECGQTGYTSTHNAGTPKNKNRGHSKNHGVKTLNTKQKYRKIIRPTAKGEANEAGFSSRILFIMFSPKHPPILTLCESKRAIAKGNKVRKKREQGGLDKNDWEF